MDFIKVFFQRRLLAAAIQMLAGWAGIEASDEVLSQIGVALLTFVPAAMNLLSYFSKVEIAGLEPAMIAGVIPILGAVADAAGVPIPADVKQAATESTAVLMSAIMGLLSANTTNPVQPAGALASKNP